MPIGMNALKIKEKKKKPIKDKVVRLVSSGPSLSVADAALVVKRNQSKTKS